MQYTPPSALVLANHPLQRFLGLLAHARHDQFVIFPRNKSGTNSVTVELLVRSIDSEFPAQFSNST